MKEHFRVAQKIGLMFRPEEPLPKDVKSWALKQLHSSSIALGIESVGSEVKPWPKSLQPDLDQRAAMWRLYRENVKKQRAKIYMVLCHLRVAKGFSGFAIEPNL